MCLNDLTKKKINGKLKMVLFIVIKSGARDSAL